jgi:2-polyprenyl-3-methyl-5-hydroxy-6-metoxy-1,4-benzoquinol methylase
MKKDILILLPSRSNGTGREHNVERFIESWKQHTDGLSDLCVLLDDDDEFRYKKHTDIIYSINPNVRFVPKVNNGALKYKDQYKYIANFSDDFIIKSKWESNFIEFFTNNNGVGIAYGNDLLQSDKLPTAVCMTSNIISELGYMVPTCLQHMYADNFWKDLGLITKTLKYFPDIIFEHVHPDAGKSERDTQYKYAAEVAGTDYQEYMNYINSEFKSDVQKILYIRPSMRYKAFVVPHSHDADFYRDIELADHINQDGHRPRLLQVSDYVAQLTSADDRLTICDFGCGNGGLVREIEAKLPNKIWGYDLLPANVTDAHTKGNDKNITYKDFITDTDGIEYPDVAICTEVLEHLVDPDAFLVRLLDNNVQCVVASSPDYETPNYHAPFHLWVFNGDSYKDMFINAGWNVILHHKDFFQYIVAVRP